MTSPCVEVLIDNANITPTVSAALERLNADVLVRRFDAEFKPRAQRTNMARLVITNDAQSIAGNRMPMLMQHCDADPCATLVLSPHNIDNTESSATAVPNSRHAIDFAGQINIDDLMGRLTTMCRMQSSMASLRAEIQTMKHKEAADTARLNDFSEQVRLARQVQQDLLPQSPPKVNGINLDTWFVPSGEISGDIYDIHRLDETHVAIAIADATGHGIPAALLSVFIKRSMIGKVSNEKGYRLLEPHEVLQHLNQDVLHLGLSQCQFLAALYAVYDEQTQTLTWARGGAPYPIITRANGDVEHIKSAGPLVGVVDDSIFETVSVKLEPGDTIMLHTDGIEDVLNIMHPEAPRGNIHETPWFTQLNQNGIAPSLEQLKSIRHNIENSTTDFDDITVITIQAVDAKIRKPETPQRATSPFKNAIKKNTTTNPKSLDNATIIQTTPSITDTTKIELQNS